VADRNGNSIRHPIKMSDFQERPKFYQSKKKVKGMNNLMLILWTNLIMNKNSHENSRMPDDILLLMPNHSDKNSFMKKKQIIMNRRRGQESGNLPSLLICTH